MKAVILGWRRNFLEKELEDCYKISSILAKDGYNIYTGAGDGFMKMGNKGAFEIDPSKSHGISVESIYHKENQGNANKYYKKENLYIAKNFAERKELLFKDANLIIFFPGGTGTLDEFTDLLNLFKTKELKEIPIILYGYKYWNSLISWYQFNNIKFPTKYIEKVIDSVEEFNKFYNGEVKFTDKLVKKKKKSASKKYAKFFDISNSTSVESYSNSKTSKDLEDHHDNADNSLSELVQKIFNEPNFLQNEMNNTDMIAKNTTITNNSEDELVIEFVMDNVDDYENIDEYENEDDNKEDIILDSYENTEYTFSNNSHKSKTDNLDTDSDDNSI